MMATVRLDDVSYYELLQVSLGVDRATLQQHFHAFAFAFHPDRYAGEDPSLQESAKRVFARGVEAYTVLRNPAAMVLYEQRRRNGHLRLSAEDFQSLSFVRSTGRSSIPAPTPKRVSVEGPLAASMTTAAGRIAAERVDGLIQARRYRDAYLEAGLLEALEPNNQAVRERADTIAAYLKQGKAR